MIYSCFKTQEENPNPEIHPGLPMRTGMAGSSRKCFITTKNYPFHFEQRLVISVVAFSLILIIFFFVPAIKNDLFRLSEMTGNESPETINLTHNENRGVEAVESHKMSEKTDNSEARAGEADDADIDATKRQRKGPPKKTDRLFHFHTARDAGKSSNNESLQFHGPSNSRQASFSEAFQLA